MKSKLITVNEVPTVKTLCSWLEEGIIKIPKYQRGYVWEKNQAMDLADSIKTGIPIPSITVAELRGQKKNELYVIDGQQRLLSLWMIKDKLWCTDRGRRFIDQRMREGSTFLGIFASNWYDPRDYESVDYGIEDNDILVTGVPLTRIQPGKEMSYEEYSKTLKTLFQRINTGGTQMTSREVERLIELDV
jgi:hypothetical protein